MVLSNSPQQVTYQTVDTHLISFWGYNSGECANLIAQCLVVSECPEIEKDFVSKPEWARAPIFQSSEALSTYQVGRDP